MNSFTASVRERDRQLLTESVLLAAAGGALGMLFAYWGKDFLLFLRPVDPMVALRYE